MPAYSAVRSTHKTSTTDVNGGVVDTVTLSDTSGWRDGRFTLEVVNRGTTDPLFVRVGTSDAAPPAPAVNADESLIVPADNVLSLTVPGKSTANSVVVKLVAASAVPYSVQVA